MRKILSLSLALVLCFAFVGCAEEKEALTPEQINQIVIDAVNTVAQAETYKFDMDMSMTMAVVGGTDPGTMTMGANATGVIDNINQEMQMVTDMTMNVPHQDEQRMQMEIYIVNEWVYAKTSIGEEWMKTELTPEMWEMQKQVEQQIELLETATEVKLLRSEVVDGVYCYVFGITPDMWKLVEYMSQLAGMEGTGLEEIEAFEQWIAKDSSFFTKAKAYMFMEVTPEDVGVTEEEFEKMTMDINMGMVAYDYNQPVSIELPPEALEAPEMPVM